MVFYRGIQRPQATGDQDFVLQKILPVLKDMVDWHYKGTRYNIHVDTDGFLHAGEPGQQLTWMDARIGDWVVTPRTGKPVGPGPLVQCFKNIRRTAKAKRPAG